MKRGLSIHGRPPFASDPRDERPTLAQIRRDDERAEYDRDPDEGICGGCLERVSPFVRDPGYRPGGAGTWRGGPWHSACRDEDRDAGGTIDVPPEGSP